MNKKYSLAVSFGVLLGFTVSGVAGQVIDLVSGQQVMVQGVTITCNTSSSAPVHNPISDTIQFNGETYKMSVNSAGHGIVRNLNTGVVRDLGASILEAPSAIVYKNELYFFARGTDKALYFRTLRPGDVWQGLGGGIEAPPIVNVLNGEVYMVVRGSDRAVWYRTFNQDWISLGGGTIDIISVTPINSNNLFIQATGDDHNLWERTLTSGWVLSN